MTKRHKKHTMKNEIEMHDDNISLQTSYSDKWMAWVNDVYQNHLEASEIKKYMKLQYDLINKPLSRKFTLEMTDRILNHLRQKKYMKLRYGLINKPLSRKFTLKMTGRILNHLRQDGGIVIDSGTTVEKEILERYNEKTDRWEEIDNEE